MMKLFRTYFLYLDFSIAHFPPPICKRVRGGGQRRGDIGGFPVKKP